MRIKCKLFLLETAEHIQQFNLVENAATEISYRCIRCRDCKDCLNNEHIKKISIRKEVEQDSLDKSVKVNTENRCPTAKLSFMHNPMVNSSNNKDIALKIYTQQLRESRCYNFREQTSTSRTCRLCTEFTERTIAYAVRNGDEILHSLESCVETKLNQYPLQSCNRFSSNNKYWI